MTDTIDISIRGRKFTVDAAHESFWRLCERGEWEPYTFDVFDRYLTREHTFVDVGAWIGPTALYAAPLVCSLEIAEPDPVAFNCLLDNLCRNETANVGARCFAITDSNSSINIGSEELGNSMTRVSCASHAINVAACTLESFCRSLNAPLFIKMDIEGSEELVLRDLTFFEQRRPTLYLSLHPQWWEHVDATWLQFKRLGVLYRYQEQVAENVWLFTNEEAHA